MEKLTLDSSCCFEHQLLQPSVMRWRLGGAVLLFVLETALLFAFFYSVLK